MQYFLLPALFISLLTSLSPLSAQTVLRAEPGSISTEMHIDETTLILDKGTGKPISYQAYEQRIKEDRNGYHLEPIFNEYGEAKAYLMRTTTADERETHRFNDRDRAQRPKIGEPVPDFIMKGIDNKVYRSTDLKGRVIVLSFWISLRKPFWSANQAKSFADALSPYQSETDPVSLGILQDSKQSILTVMAAESLPFMPVPNAYGFHKKFQVTTGPTVMVIDRTGKLAAYLEGDDFLKLQKVLQAVSR